MMQRLMSILFIAVVLFVVNTRSYAHQIIEKDGYKISVYNYKEIEPLFHPDGDDDTVYVFNFWATYCAPCIKELPYFDRIGEEYSDKKVKVILVSLDFKKQIESGVIPFLKRRAIKSDVVVLSDPDANAWIDKINPNWSGAIPATLIVKGSQREFYEQEFTYEELQSLITKFIKQ